MPCSGISSYIVLSRLFVNKDEAGSKVILARSLFFGYFSVFTCKFEKYHICTQKSLMQPDNIPNMLQYWQ